MQIDGLTELEISPIGSFTESKSKETELVIDTTKADKRLLEPER